MASPVLTMKAQGELITVQLELIDLYQCVETGEYKQAKDEFARAGHTFNNAKNEDMFGFIQGRFEFIKAQIKFIKAQYELIEHYAFFEDNNAER
jgi:hypothetical protein